MSNIKHYINEFGDDVWLLDGEYHREDGPAVVYTNGIRVWYQYGNIHRTDGPAIMYTNGVSRWAIRGKEYTFDTYCKALNLDPATVLELKLKYM